jgi:hypothetical protein
MKFVIGGDLSSEFFARKRIFIDNDFLSVLFEDFDALEQLVSLTQDGYLLIDPLTRFEFLQTVFLPAQREFKEKFIDNDEIFLPVPDHYTIFQNVRDNALKLSYVYAHSGCKGASVVDLLLASRAIIQGKDAYIITGNRKDFPALIFDTVGILSYETKEFGQIKSYPVVKFNSANYAKATRRLQDLKKKA